MLGPAHAVETVCTGTLPPAGSPYGNVVVPAGQTCAISGVRIDGNVTVFGSLTVAALTTDTTIRGNVNSKDGCGLIVIGQIPGPASVVIGGNVDIDHCVEGVIGSGGSGFTAGEIVANGVIFGSPQVLIGKNLKCTNNAARCTIQNTVVGGNVDLSDNASNVGATGSFVGGSLTANNNGGAVAFFNNAIGGNLKCAGNPAVNEVDNIVAGNKQGQCASP